MDGEPERFRVGVLTAAPGVSRTALLVALVDRAANDRSFAAELRREPVSTAARLGLWLSDCEWNGLRAFLAEGVAGTWPDPGARNGRRMTVW